jgi:hypothetical protein
VTPQQYETVIDELRRNRGGRKPTGQVVERERKHGTVYALRFRAYGRREYETLGSTRDGWTRKLAEEELERRLAEVKLGLYIPPEREPAGDDEEEREHTQHAYLDTVGQIAALLDAAAELDGETKRYRHGGRHAMLAVLAFAGLRLGELLAGDQDDPPRCIRCGRSIPSRASGAAA